eukprot:6326485-Pyramimonas_sp.AAC.1
MSGPRTATVTSSSARTCPMICGSRGSDTSIATPRRMGPGAGTVRRCSGSCGAAPSTSASVPSVAADGAYL